MSDESGGTFIFRFGNCELNEATGELRVRGEPVDIEPRPRVVLLILLRRAGELVTKNELVDLVWEGCSYGDQTVGNAIAKVRKALGDIDSEIVRNVRNKGYLLALPVDRQLVNRKGAVDLRVGMLVPGRTNWHLVEKLGSGGFGDVWLCHAKDGERRVFKFSTASEHDVALKREVTLCRLLRAALSEEQKQSIVELLDWSLEHRPYYIEFEYAGDNLRNWASKRGGLVAIGLQERLEIMATIATAVGAAHSIGILHKDLKPENILMDERDGVRRICLSDFGAGALLDTESLNRFDITVRGLSKSHASDSKTGTFSYMAPELLEGARPTWQSDIYSLGILLYQFVVGDFGRLLAADWIPDVEDELLREDIELATRRDPRQRLADAQQLGHRLRILEQRRTDRESQRVAKDRALKAEEQLRRAKARRPLILTSLALLVICLLIIIYFFAREVRRERAALAMKTFVEGNVIGGEDPLYYGGDPPLSFLDPVLQSPPLGLAELALQESTVDYNSRVYGNQDPRTLRAVIDEARTLVLLSRADDATSSLNGVASYVAALPHDNALQLNLGYVQALLLRATFQIDVAADRFNGLVRNCESLPDIDSDLCLRIDFHAATTFYRAKRYDQAEQLTRMLLEKVIQRYGAGSAAMAARVELGAILIKLGRLTEARSNLETARQWLVRSTGTSDILYVEAVQYLAEAAEISGDWDAAIGFRVDAREQIARLSGLNSAPTQHADLLLARTLLHAGRVDEALVLSRQVLQWVQTGTDHNLIAAAQVTLGQVLLLQHTADIAQIEAALPAEKQIKNDEPLRGLICYIRARMDNDTATALSDAARASELMARSGADGGVDAKEIKGFIARMSRSSSPPVVMH